MKKLILLIILGVCKLSFGYAQEMSFKVEGLTCEMCANTATSALKAIKGVKTARVDFNSKQGVVELDGTVTQQQIKDAIASKNFEAVFADDTKIKPLTEAEKKGLDIAEIKGGTKLKFKEHLIEGKITIFDFYADWCGPCKLFSPKLERLVKENGELALVKVDLVDWKSPIAKQLTNQYQLPALPFTLVFNDSGKLIGKIEGNNIEAVKTVIANK